MPPIKPPTRPVRFGKREFKIRADSARVAGIGFESPTVRALRRAAEAVPDGELWGTVEITAAANVKIENAYKLARILRVHCQKSEGHVTLWGNAATIAAFRKETNTSP